MIYTIFSIEIAQLVLWTVTAVALVTTYLRTRNIGFVWLGGAAVLWPILSNLLQRQAIHALRVGAVGSTPFVRHPETSFGAVYEALSLSGTAVATLLMLIAVLYLGRTPQKDQAEPLD
jgi:hypothetical protein